MPKLISYEIIQFDQDFNKLAYNTLNLDNLLNEITLHQDMAYCIISYDYTVSYFSEPQRKVKILDRKDIINGYTDNLYTLTEYNDRAVYKIQLQYE
ncbi:MAG: hypothetical protein GX490_03675 [Bacilli bacterium]|nr:hypothetical protein [Bacilli bacterium]